MAYLSVVECNYSDDRVSLLLELDGMVKRAIACEDDVHLPLIDLALSAVYCPDAIVDAGEYGQQVSVMTGILWRGERRKITAVPVALEDGLGLVLPRGFLA